MTQTRKASQLAAGDIVLLDMPFHDCSVTMPVPRRILRVLRNSDPVGPLIEILHGRIGDPGQLAYAQFEPEQFVAMMG